MSKEDNVPANESKIIELAKKQPDAFALLYDYYHKPIFIFIYKKVRNKEQTADITQQVFLKAMLNLNKYVYRGFPFSSWLYRIAQNEVNMLFRSNKKMIETEISENDAKTLAEEISNHYSDEEIECILKIVANLPEEQNNLIEMRFFQKLSFKEIGSIFEISEDNAKVKIYRILDKLKKAYNKEQKR